MKRRGEMRVERRRIKGRRGDIEISNQGNEGDRMAIEEDQNGVTCRWHVPLDVSWVGSVAKSAEMTVLRSDPKPLLSESVGELTRVL
jgi:hypothetical protein